MPKAENFKGIWEIAVSFFYPILPYPSPHPPSVGLKNYWSVPKPISTYFPISCNAGAGMLLHQYSISKLCLISLLSYAFISQTSKDSKKSFCDLSCCCVVSYCCYCFTWIFLVLAKLNFLLLFIHSVVSDSLQPHGLQHTRLPCPSLSPRVWMSIMLLFALQEGKII